MEQVKDFKYLSCRISSMEVHKNLEQNIIKLIEYLRHISVDK
jgi:hypothetical protein